MIVIFEFVYGINVSVIQLVMLGFQFILLILDKLAIYLVYIYVQIFLSFFEYLK